MSTIYFIPLIRSHLSNFYRVYASKMTVHASNGVPQKPNIPYLGSPILAWIEGLYVLSKLLYHTLPHLSIIPAEASQ